MGPNFKKLVALKMSLDAIPPGGGVAEGLAFLTSPRKVNESARAARVWVTQAIALVKAAPDNPYGDDDELIAGEILSRMKKGE